jgi:hypothetical protein
MNLSRYIHSTQAHTIAYVNNSIFYMFSKIEFLSAVRRKRFPVRVLQQHEIVKLVRFDVHDSEAYCKNIIIFINNLQIEKKA